MKRLHPFFSLGALIGAFALMSGAHAGSNDPARVRAFAALPDWSGIWRSEAWPLDVSGRVPGGETRLRQLLQLIRPPPYNSAWKAKYEEGMKDTAVLAAKNATFKACTRSYPAVMEAPWMFQIAVLPEQTLVVFENGQVRHVYTDGREHPPEDELWPTQLGDSVGHWKGDTLIIDTTARRPNEPLAPRAWVSLLSDRAHFTEELRLLGKDTLENVLTIDDPVALEHPWRIR
ncbi:MAG TPA: hypothetical protein VF221_19745, partial [Chloroflexota bacterium]